MNDWHNMKSEPLSSQFWDKLMINGVAIPGVLSVSWIDQQLADPEFRGIFDQEWSKMHCRKCAGKNTRRHHRKCQKRGKCHKGREGLARRAELACREYGFDVRVRRGRHGKGTSLDKANCDVLRVIARLCKPVDSLRSSIVATYGPNAKIETPEPGMVSITTDKKVDSEHAKAFSDYCWGMRILVNGVEI